MRNDFVPKTVTNDLILLLSCSILVMKLIQRDEPSANFSRVNRGMRRAQDTWQHLNRSLKLLSKLAQTLPLRRVHPQPVGTEYTQELVKCQQIVCWYLKYDKL